MEPGPASALLEMLLNDPAVYRDIEAMTGCDPISHFVGLLYRMIPEQGHEHQAQRSDWGPHDCAERHARSRRLRRRHLELRDRPTGRILDATPNPAPGDAVIFALDPSLQHRVTRVTAGAKTAFAGWSRGGPRTCFDVLRSAIS